MHPNPNGGDSAKSMAVAGLSVVGRNEYGVFPLKGKIINVREKTVTAKGREQVLNNTEINNLKKILGLQSDKEYSNTNVGDLRYGRIMVMTVRMWMAILKDYSLMSLLLCGRRYWKCLGL